MENFTRNKGEIMQTESSPHTLVDELDQLITEYESSKTRELEEKIGSMATKILKSPLAEDPKMKTILERMEKNNFSWPK